MKTAARLQHHLINKLKQWHTCQTLAKLDSLCLKDIGVNRWELINQGSFNKGEQA
jgi:uncharacterized protein YjiS (DUF1127 family)